MNEALFLSIYHLSGDIPLLDSLMILITNYALYLIYILIIVLAIPKNSTGRKTLLLIITTFVIASIATKVLRIVVIEDRPFVTLDIQPLIENVRPKSFPSLHTLYSWIPVFGLWVMKSKLTWLFAMIASVISFSRIYLGVHYPFDIVGGIVVAGLSCLFAKYLLKRLNLF